jgi:uncharacterized protein YcbK (DUF882 family)
MGLVGDAEHREFLKKRGLRGIAASTLLAVMIGAGTWFGSAYGVSAGGETRTLSLYHIHTGESLTITYKVDGRYIPSALEKINRLMRDWRRNEVISIDPKTLDLMWELHADLGSARPIHIICGYRSPKTNSFLKRIGRNVARKSQHMLGKAIDLYFPDVPTEKIRNSALVRQVGGVGYYRSAGGPTGFVHIDSGRVRHWPHIGSSQMAKIFRNSRTTIGARRSRQDQIMVASAESEKAPKSAAAVVAESNDFDDEAVSSPNFTAPLPRAKPSSEPLVDLAKGYPVPKPRPKPIEVLMMAAANMQIEPASAPPPRVNFAEQPSPVEDSLGVVAAADSMIEDSSSEPIANSTAKGSFADSLRDGTAEGTPMIKPLIASTSGDETFWWPKRLVFSPEHAVRRDGAPQIFANGEPQPIEDLGPLAEEVSSSPIPLVSQANAQPMVISSLMTVSTGKSDRLEVNRSAKGGFLVNGGQPQVKGFSSITDFLFSGTEN